MISSGINSTLSALQGFQKKQESIANNVANVNTDEFKKTRVTFYEGENGTVTPHVEKIETPGSQVYEQTAEGSTVVEKSNVDLVEEIPQAMINKRNFQANIKMLQIGDEMTGYLIDMIT
jgi:flagellar basal-body rod protein FlgC